MKRRPKLFLKHSRARKFNFSCTPFPQRRKNNNDQDYKPRKKSSSGTGEVLDSSSKRFSWLQYLETEHAVAVPDHVFKNLTFSEPIPSSSNTFQVGFLLEAVDPHHQSLITLVSVVSILGYRLCLHFEGFSSINDFWVNCDSPFIFPCGFCEKTGRSLATPLGFEAKDFNWRSYAKDKGFTIAPESAFVDIVYENVTGFKLLDRIEAVDRQHPELICVASIADAIGRYVLVHFDGWNSYYDYWCLNTSSYMKPVGWCSENGRDLSPPLHLGEQKFNWNDYLDSNNLSAAKASSFSNAHHGFKVEMKLEVIDPRNPILARVASVADTDEYRVLIHFDGWGDVYDVWMDIDNRDLHPINWSSRTGQILLTAYDVKEENDQQKICPVANCLGHGHIRRDRFSSHHSEFGCPYSIQNRNREPLPDRFQLANVTEKTYNHLVADANNHIKPNSIVISTKKRGRPRGGSIQGNAKRKNELHSVNYNQNQSDKHKLPRKTTYDDHSHSLLHDAAILVSCIESGQQKMQQPLPWQNYMSSFSEIEGKTLSDINLWTIKQVSLFVKKLTGSTDCEEAFSTQEIDGKAFLMLTQQDITSVMKLKLGPSLKIFNAIVSIRNTCSKISV